MVSAKWRWKGSILASISVCTHLAASIVSPVARRVGLWLLVAGWSDVEEEEFFFFLDKVINYMSGNGVSGN